MISFISLVNNSSTLMPMLLDVAIKSVLILLIAKVILLLTRGASAATRHLILSGTLCGLLALPVLMLMLPAWQLPIFPSLLSTTAASTAQEASTSEDAFASEALLKEQHLERGSRSDTLLYSSHIPFSTQVWHRTMPSPVTDVVENIQLEPAAKSVASPSKFSLVILLLIIWFSGALVVLLRMLLGTMRVWWVTRRAEPLADISWQMMTHNLATKLRLRKSVKLQRSERVAVPMTWGTVRPVVLLPEQSEEWSLQCRSIVLLHELAHVKRHDCLTQMMAQLACALYWFNPLVWFAAQQLRVEREFACDDQVLEAGTRASDYASHLVEIASAFRLEAEVSSMAVGMACSELESRVRAILNTKLSRTTINLSQMILALVGVTFLVLPLAIVQPWANAATRSVNRPVFTESSTDKSETSLAEVDSSVLNSPLHATITDENRQKSSLTHTHESKEQHQVEVSTTIQSEAIQEAVKDEKDSQDEEQSEKSSAKDEKPSTKPSVDGAIKLKTFNISPEFIESMRKLGFENLSINQLVQLRVHNINEDFIREARGWGYDNLSLNQLVHLRIAGVTGDYLATMKRAGFNNLTVNKLASLRLHNVTPEFIDMMRRQGYDNLSIDQLLSLRVHGITEEFIKSTESWGYGKLSVNDLSQVRMFDVNPNFAREMKTLGFDNLSLQKLIQLRIHGVNTAYVNEMRGMGFDNLSLDELLQMRIHGITASYIKMMRDAGFKNVSVKELIKMRISGVDEILLKKNR